MNAQALVLRTWRPVTAVALLAVGIVLLRVASASESYAMVASGALLLVMATVGLYGAMRRRVSV